MAKDYKKAYKQLQKELRIVKAEALILQHKYDLKTQKVDLLSQLLDFEKKHVELMKAGLPEYQIPKRIEILGRSIKIIRKNKLYKGDVKCQGLYYHQKGVIMLSKEAKLNTFLHEIIHAIHFAIPSLSTDGEILASTLAIIFDGVFKSILPIVKVNKEQKKNA